MQFDFETFSTLAARAYEEGPYTLEEAEGVFWYYFLRYEVKFGRAHPRIRMEQIRHIMRIMPYIDQESIGGYLADVEPECYKDMIDQHFRTAYRNCDYNINHFFSGKVRELRWYETCY